MSILFSIIVAQIGWNGWEGEQPNPIARGEVVPWIDQFGDSNQIVESLVYDTTALPGSSSPLVSVGADTTFPLPDDAGRYPADYFWIPESHGYVIDDSALWTSDHDEFMKSLPELKSKFKPILVIMSKKNGIQFVMDHFALHAFLTRKAGCSDCLQVNRMTKSIQAAITAQINHPAKYRWVVTHKSQFLDTIPTYTEIRDAFQVGGWRLALQLQPWMFEYRKLDVIDSALPPSSPDDHVPRWVIWHFSGNGKMSVNPSWISAAKRELHGLSWKEFVRVHKRLPGDRTVIDLQYNYLLRGPSSPDSIDPCNTPDHACVLRLFQTSKQQTAKYDTMTGNALADGFLRGHK